jgi:putative transposase
MPDDVARYPRYRFPPAIISHAVWLYYRFTLGFGDVEDLLAQRGITVSYESIRRWCEIFGARNVPRLGRTVTDIDATLHAARS